MIYFSIVLLALLGIFTCITWKETEKLISQENYNNGLIETNKKENIQEHKDSKKVTKKKITIA